MCQDHAHVFIAAARSLLIPARYVGGYLCRSDGVVAQEAGHARVEAFVPDLGWIAFDPANGICATEAHVPLTRLARSRSQVDLSPLEPAARASILPDDSSLVESPLNRVAVLGVSP